MTGSNATELHPESVDAGILPVYRKFCTAGERLRRVLAKLKTSRKERQRRIALESATPGKAVLPLLCLNHRRDCAFEDLLRRCLGVDRCQDWHVRHQQTKSLFQLGIVASVAGHADLEWRLLGQAP